ncbi:hypothetical protein V8E54_006066 [Elaphomyces granulatus]
MTPEPTRYDKIAPCLVKGLFDTRRRRGRKSQLPSWGLDVYEKLSAAMDGPNLTIQVFLGKILKNLLRDFDALGLLLIIKDNHIARISDIHHAARLDGDINFKNCHLSLVVASKQTATFTTNANRLPR